MDDRRFDALTRIFGRGGSRRGLLRAVLGLSGVAGASAILHDTEAARRGQSGPPTSAPPSTSVPSSTLPPPSPTFPPSPTGTAVPKCPGSQTPCGADCCCPAGNTKCGPACCPDGQAECCDGACCYGTCYGEELCCPTGDPVCSVDGCCQGGKCVVQGQFCCQDAHVCGDSCCLASEHCCASSGGASTCSQCCSDTDCTDAHCIDGTCVPFTATPTVTPTNTPSNTPTTTPTNTNTPTITPTSTPTNTPTAVLTPELSKIWFSYIPYGGNSCCFCSARVELLGVQPNWNYEANLYVWDGPGNPEPTTSVESQPMSTDGDGAALIVFNTNINNEDNSSSAQWAKVIVNGVATDWLQANCENFATNTPTNTPTNTATPTNTPTATSTPSATPTSTPPSTLAVQLGLQIFGSLQTCLALVLLTGARASTSYAASLFVWDGPGHPTPEQPVETIGIFTFANGQGRGTFRTLLANTTGQYAQVVVLGVGSGWVPVDSSTCEPS